MTNLRNSFFFIAILLSTPAFGWQNTPEAALEEMVTADKLEIMAKHLPVRIQQAIEKLDDKKRKEISAELLVRSNMKQEGRTFDKSDDGTVWELKNKKGELEGTIRVKDSFISGAEALLIVEFKRSPEPSDAKEPSPERRPAKLLPDSLLILVSMRLEEGEWRMTAFGPWEHQNVDSADFLRELVPDEQAANAAAAASTFRTLNTALITYATTYPETGLPANLKQLAGSPDSEPSSQHAMLLDPSFATVPVIRDGYEFRYTLIEPGALNPETDKETRGRYTITATPVEFGKTGSKSFFTDQSCVIRSTTENREANENDEPI